MKKNEINKMNKGIATLLAIMMATIMALTACGQTAENAEAETESVEGTVVEPEEEILEPLSAEDLDGLLSGVEDHYVLQDAENVDYMQDVTYDETVGMAEDNSNSEKSGDTVKDARIIYRVTADDSEVNVAESGTYQVTYTVKVNRPAYEAYVEQATEDKPEDESENAEETAIEDEKAGDAGTKDDEETAADVPEEDLEEVLIEKDIEVVDQERAQELVEAGESVWADDNRDYGEILEEEKKAEESKDDNNLSAKAETKTEEKGDEKTEDTTKKEENTSSSANKNTDSGKSSSGSGSCSSKAEAHTHNYTATVTKAATCGSTGTKTYKCSCGTSYTESIPATGNHNWQTTYTEKQVWVEDSAGYSQYVCKYPGCGYTTRDGDSIALHNLDTCHTWTTQHVDATGHYETEKVASGFKCSVCGATK